MAVHGLGRRGLELYSQMTLPEPELAGEVVKQLDYSPVLGLMRAHGVDADRLAEWVFGGAVEVSKVARGLSDSGVPVPVAVQRAALVFGPADSGGALQVLSKPGWLPAAYEDAGLRVVVPWAASQSDSISKEWIVRLDDRLFVNRDEQGRFAAVAHPSQPAVAMEGAQAVAMGGAGAGAEDPEAKIRAEREAAEEAQRRRKAVLRRREAAGAQRESLKRRKKAREARRAKEKQNIAESDGGGPGAEQKKGARRKRRREAARRLLAGDLIEVPPPKADADPDWDKPDDRLEFADLMGNRNYLMAVQPGYFQVPLEMAHEAFSVTSHGDVTRTNGVAAAEKATRLRVATLQKHLGGKPVRFHTMSHPELDKVPMFTRDASGQWHMNISTKYGLVYTNGTEVGAQGVPFYVHPSVNVLFGNDILSGKLLEVLRDSTVDPTSDEWDFPDGWVKPLGRDAFAQAAPGSTDYLDVGRNTISKMLKKNLRNMALTTALRIKKIYGLNPDEPLLGNLYKLRMEGMGTVVDGEGLSKAAANDLDAEIIVELASMGELGKMVDADVLNTSQARAMVSPLRRRAGVDRRDAERARARLTGGRAEVTQLTSEGEEVTRYVASDRELLIDSSTTKGVQLDDVAGTVDVIPLKIASDLAEQSEVEDMPTDVAAVLDFEEMAGITDGVLKVADDKGTSYSKGVKITFDTDSALQEMAAGTVRWPERTPDEKKKASRLFTAITAASVLAAMYNNDPSVEGSRFSQDGTENIAVRVRNPQQLRDSLRKWSPELGEGVYNGILNSLQKQDGGYVEAVRTINQVNRENVDSFRQLFQGLNM